MFTPKKYQSYILGFFVSFILFILGFVILAISFFSANRHQAATIKEISTGIINSYLEKGK